MRQTAATPRPAGPALELEVPPIAFGASLPGPGKARNEDAYLSLHEQRLYAVADGIGGLDWGWFASAMALSALSEFFWATDGLPTSQWRPEHRAVIRNGEERLLSATRYAHARVLEASTESIRLPMGTTLVAAWVTRTEVRVAHVGDSRCYLVTNGRLRRVTEDHVYSGALGVGNGARRGVGLRGTQRPRPDALTRAVGLGDDARFQPGFVAFPRHEVDHILLVSDGVTKVLSDRQLQAAGRFENRSARRVSAILRRVADQGLEDDATALWVDLSGADDPLYPATRRHRPTRR